MRRARVVFAVGAVSVLVSTGLAQGTPPPPAAGSHTVVLDVVVERKSEPPVAGLTEKDFTVLDNKAPQRLTSFKAVDGQGGGPIRVVLLLDAVNVGYDAIAYERGEIDKFLKANGGKLLYPTTLAVFSDTKTEIQPSFTTDGEALSASLDQYTIALRTIRRSAGIYGAVDRLDLSIKALSQLATREGALPGRKVILWVSPGWPLLSGPGTDLDRKQQNGFFGDVVRMSDLLRKNRITLYAVDPLGTNDAGGLRTFYYKQFVKGVTKPDEVSPGDLGLQVLAEQSGGLALNSSNDVTGELRRCMADTQAYYEMTYEAAPAEQPNEYHHVEVKVAEPGLTVRARQGYYAQP